MDNSVPDRESYVRKSRVVKRKKKKHLNEIRQKGRHTKPSSFAKQVIKFNEHRQAACNPSGLKNKRITSGRLTVKTQDGMYLKGVRAPFVFRESLTETNAARKNEDLNKIIDIGRGFVPADKKRGTSDREFDQGSYLDILKEKSKKSMRSNKSREKLKKSVNSILPYESEENVKNTTKRVAEESSDIPVGTFQVQPPLITVHRPQSSPEIISSEEHVRGQTLGEKFSDLLNSWNRKISKSSHNTENRSLNCAASLFRDQELPDFRLDQDMSPILLRPSPRRETRSIELMDLSPVHKSFSSSPKSTNHYKSPVRQSSLVTDLGHFSIFMDISNRLDNTISKYLDKNFPDKNHITKCFNTLNSIYRQNLEGKMNVNRDNVGLTLSDVFSNKAKNDVLKPAFVSSSPRLMTDTPRPSFAGDVSNQENSFLSGKEFIINNASHEVGQAYSLFDLDKGMNTLPASEKTFQSEFISSLQYPINNSMSPSRYHTPRRTNEYMLPSKYHSPHLALSDLMADEYMPPSPYINGELQGHSPANSILSPEHFLPSQTATACQFLRLDPKNELFQKTDLGDTRSELQTDTVEHKYRKRKMF